MCNCGGSGSGSRAGGVSKSGEAGGAARPASWPRVEVVYLGRTALSAIGPATGTRYRFEGPGSRLQVDARDAAALLALPRLARVGPNWPGATKP